jgi:uncharacterized membrane protein HdeD (DUF308 family)
LTASPRCATRPAADGFMKVINPRALILMDASQNRIELAAIKNDQNQVIANDQQSLKDADADGEAPKVVNAIWSYQPPNSLPSGFAMIADDSPKADVPSCWRHFVSRRSHAGWPHRQWPCTLSMWMQGRQVMTTPHRSEPFQEPMPPMVEHIGKGFIALAIAFILLGTLAILEPFVAGLAVTKLVGVVLLVGGIMHFIGAFRGEGARSRIWQVIVAVFYVIAGFFFLGNPLMGLTTLTLFLSGVLFIEAFTNLGAYFQLRPMAGSGWLLANAIITFLLALMIWRHWPGISVWVIGTIVGIDLIVNGVTRLALGKAARSGLRRFAA